MQRPTKKKRKAKDKTSATGAASSDRTPPEDYLPDAKDVTEVKELVSPRGNRYTVLVSTERDPYDEPDGDEKKN